MNNSKQDLTEKIKLWLIPRVISLLMVLSKWTTRLRVFGEDNTEHLSDEDAVIYTFWHGLMWVPIYYFRNQGLIGLTSSSQDGEYLSRLLRRFGWQVVRGSSTRGGGRSLLKLYRQILKGERGVITPDGPTGPRYEVKPGVIYLQEKSGGYIIPVGVAADRKYNADSWDKFMIPYPGSRIVVQIGRPLQFSSEKSIEERCQLLKEEMNCLQKEAEQRLSQWKENGG